VSSIAPEEDSYIFNSFKEYEYHFDYKGERVYSLIFERNKDRIKVNKEKFAIRNLQKIFDATFLISPKIGFQAMSLRDLSTETGLSMGGLYSSISSKEAIPVMVKDVVAVICDEIVDASRNEVDPLIALQILVRGYLYSSTLMQSWFNFLYFETKSLPEKEQESSKQLELKQANELAQVLQKLKPKADIDFDFVSIMAVSLIQERYIKPWKYHNPQSTIDQYADDSLGLILKTIDYQAT